MVLLSKHFVSDIEAIADTIAVLDEWNLVVVDRCNELSEYYNIELLAVSRCRYKNN